MVCLRAQQVNNKHSVCGMGSPKFVDILPKEHLPHQTQLLIITNSLRLHMCASKLWTVLYTVHVLMHLWKNSSCEMCISARRAMATVDETAVMFSTSDILFWLTGSRHLPAVGFCSPIKVHFYNDPLPHVSTCGLYVQLPVHKLQHARSSVKSDHWLDPWLAWFWPHLTAAVCVCICVR